MAQIIRQTKTILGAMAASSVQAKPTSSLIAETIGPSTKLGDIALAPSTTEFNPIMFFKRPLHTNPFNFPQNGGRANFAKAIHAPAETSLVNKSKPVLVRPATKTYNGPYYLSEIDQYLISPFEILYCYKGSGKGSTANAYQVIKNSLSKVLVHFYPLTGKLAMGENGMFVDCTEEGASFVEAAIEKDLEEFGDITTPNPTKLPQLFHMHDARDIFNMPLLSVQVTMFNCGGLTIGLRFNHCMMDGVSLILFMNSWTETARGIPLSVTPFLDRSILKRKGALGREFPQEIVSEIQGLFTNNEIDSLLTKTDITNSIVAPKVEEMVYTTVHFGPENLMKLKKSVTEEEGMKTTPTSFQVVTAFIWREIIRSVKAEQPRSTRSFFALDARTKFGATFPKHYFGNCLGIGYTGSYTDDQLRQTSLSPIIQQVQDAVQMVKPDYIQTFFGYAIQNRIHVPLENSFAFSHVARMPFYQADFGWGDPMHVGFPFFMNNAIMYLPHKEIHRNSITATLCLPSSAVDTFQESVKNI